MHPEIERIIAKIRQRGMLACLITNGYLLTREKIKSSIPPGLEYMQISIDNVTRMMFQRRASRCWTRSSHGYPSLLNSE